MDSQIDDRQTAAPRRRSSGLWVLVGVAAGFSVPVVACGILFIIFSLSLVAASGSGTTMVPVYVSGPVSGPTIAIIEVNGAIVSGKSGGSYRGSGLAGADEIIQAIRAADQNPDVEAMLLKVNSPGGSVVASDQIYEELNSLTKPIVVLMGELAASGGYYISMAADFIIANPNSLTGSIGVISTFPNAGGPF